MPPPTTAIELYGIGVEVCPAVAPVCRIWTRTFKWALIDMKPEDRSSALAVTFVVLLAAGIRYAILAPASFPLNDGGLFYSFILELVDNGLALPAFSAYNAAAIPFVYPPLGFYLIAILHLLSGVPVLQLLLIVPAVLSVASIPVFYLLARRILKSESAAGLGTLVFALVPRTFDWLIMGGGFTRALGLLFALLTLTAAYDLFADRKKAAILPAILFAGLLVASHPQAIVHTVLAALLFYLWHDRTRGGLKNAALVALGTLVITAPWWATVLSRHGTAPFIAAAAAGRADSYNPLVGLVALFRFDFTDEPFLRIFGVLGLLGLVSMAVRRNYLPAVWLISMHALEPRGATLFMMIPLAMAAGYCLDLVILPALSGGGARRQLDASSEARPSLPWVVQTLSSNWVRLVLAYLALYGSLAAYASGARILSDFTVTPADLRAFEWIRSSTAAESNFALVTQALPLRDSVSEWFPALAERRSVATAFGLEWTPWIDFGARLDLHRALQKCATDGEGCLEDWSRSAGETIDYVYLHIENAAGRSALHAYLAQSAAFYPVYEDGDLIIYSRR